MDIKKLFSMQRELDQSIQSGRQLGNEALLERKLLAFHVEVCELANETRCFKFWSDKPSSDPSVILEEYVDGIHFLLSVGLEYGFEDRIDLKNWTDKVEAKTLSEHFHEVIEAIAFLRKSGDFPAYRHTCRTYLALGEALGYSSADVEEAYMQKNEVNYKRQENGY